MSPRVGFFGKLPTRGDFVRSGLSPALVSAWDGWLQSVLPARSAPWPADDATRPCWRFALMAESCGPSDVSGVVLPSLDRVGRRFPLLLAVEGGTASDAVLDDLEQLGGEAVAGGLQPDDLASRLARLPPIEPFSWSGGTTSSRWWRSDGSTMIRCGQAMPNAAVFASFGLT